MPDDKKYSELILVAEAFKAMFSNNREVLTATVKPGGTSGNVYVPRKYIGCPVTVVIWVDGIKQEIPDNEK